MVAGRPIRENQPILGLGATSPAERQRNDQAIVDLVLAGDRDAFRQLVDREAGPVVLACHRVLGNLHEAEDAAQEAFVIAFRSLSSWRADGPFGAWVRRIAVRIAVREAARRKPVARLDLARVADGSVAGRESNSVAAVSIAASGRTDPPTLVIRAERAADVRTAVAALPEPYREVVALRFFGELTLDEIAREVDRPLSTVKTHLRRGLLRLRGTVEPGVDA